MRSRYHRSLLARGCTCFQLFSVQTIALHWTEPNFCRYCCWLLNSYMKWADSEQTDICCWPSMWVMLYLHNRWLGTSSFNIFQFNMDFLLDCFGKIDTPGQIMLVTGGQMSGLHQNPFYTAATYLWSRLQNSSVLYFSDIAVVVYFSDIPDDQIASQLILFAYRRLSPSSAQRW